MTTFNTVSGALTGTPTPSTYNGLPQVSNINPATYQISGLNDYLNNLQGLSTGMANAPNFAQATQGDVTTQKGLLQQYMEQINGGGPNPAAQMLHNANAAGLAQQQSLALSNQAGSNPALGMRNISQGMAQLQGNNAGQAAVLQQQQGLQAQQAATQLSASMRQSDALQAQQTYADQMQRSAAEAAIAQQGFAANTAQTNLNVTQAQNSQAYQMYMRQQALSQAQAQAQSNASMWHGILTAGGAIAGGVIGSVIPGGGTLVGAGLGSMLGGMIPTGGGSSSSSAMNPMLSAYLSQQLNPNANGNLDPNNPAATNQALGFINYQDSTGWYQGGDLGPFGNATQSEDTDTLQGIHHERS